MVCSLQMKLTFVLPTIVVVLSTVAEPVLRPGDRMVILGDSLTNQGLAVDAGDQIGYFHRLTNALARVHGPDCVTVVPLGYSGWHVPSWIETERRTRTESFRFDAAGRHWDAKVVLDGGAEIAVFFLGMNDLLKPVFDDTPESLHARIQVQEHIAFPEALNILASGKYRIEGRRVRIG